MRVDHGEVATLKYGASTIVRLRWGDTLEIVPTIEQGSGGASGVASAVQQHKAALGLGALLGLLLLFARRGV